MAESEEAARVRAPLEGTQYSRTISTAVTKYAVPDLLRGSWVVLSMKTSNLQIVFGDSSVAVVADQTSTAVTTVLTVSDSTGLPVPKNTSVSFQIQDTTAITHFSVVADAAGQWFMGLM